MISVSSFDCKSALIKGTHSEWLLTGFLDWLDQLSGSDTLHPIPVLPGDYVEEERGEMVNEGGERGAWQLVTRFTLSEGVSSQPRYASDITLR